MTSPRRNPRVLSESEAERCRSRLRKSQAQRDQARLQKIRRQNQWNRWGLRLRGAALFTGIVTFFTWIYWMAIH